ncbi:unnamed protein product [Larinioides sclopetarius]|uniref:Uncharacterized protein n=1 Tax=Larinioides sclopetarius TaxID=280406 RepID=A0AAV1ZWL9_9ARAC
MRSNFSWSWKVDSTVHSPDKLYLEYLYYIKKF